MSKRILYIAWALMYALCAGLGFIPNPKGMTYAILFIVALLFFIPPAILTYRAIKNKDIPEIKRLRNISLIWLILTLILLALNFLSVMFTEAAGLFLQGCLTVLSSPMICGRVWVVSIFLWGCLLSATWQEMHKYKKKKR